MNSTPPHDPVAYHQDLRRRLLAVATSTARSLPAAERNDIVKDLLAGGWLDDGIQAMRWLASLDAPSAD
jgi:hypothetical protein